MFNCSPKSRPSMQLKRSYFMKMGWPRLMAGNGRQPRYANGRYGATRRESYLPTTLFQFLSLFPQKRIHAPAQFAESLTQTAFVGIARRDCLAFRRLSARGFLPRLPLPDQHRLPRPLLGCPGSRRHLVPLIVRFAASDYLPRARQPLVLRC